MAPGLKIESFSRLPKLIRFRSHIHHIYRTERILASVSVEKNLNDRDRENTTKTFTDTSNTVCTLSYSVNIHNIHEAPKQMRIFAAILNLIY